MLCFAYVCSHVTLVTQINVSEYTLSYVHQFFFNSSGDFGQPVQFRDGAVGVLDADLKWRRDPQTPLN